MFWDSTRSMQLSGGAHSAIWRYCSKARPKMHLTVPITPEFKTQQSGPGGIISVRGPQPEGVIVGGPHQDSVTLPTNTLQASSTL
jgi:hypothetical protein